MIITSDDAAHVLSRKQLVVGAAVISGVMIIAVAAAALFKNPTLPGGLKTPVIPAAASNSLSTAPFPDQTRPLGRGCDHVPANIAATAAPMVVLDGSALDIIDTSSCTSTTVVRSGASGPIKISADGKWIGYGPALAVNRTGQVVVTPLGLTISTTTLHTWSWSPTEAVMAGVTVQGAVVLGTPAGPTRELEPSGWGGTELAFSDPQTLVVARGQQLWTISTVTGQASMLYASTTLRGPITLAATSSRWAVFWHQPLISASAAADGAPLIAISLPAGVVHRLADDVIVRPDAVALCGDGVAVSVGAGRDTTTSKTVTLYQAGQWQPRLVGSGVSPTCNRDGSRVAYARGSTDSVLGSEQRSIITASTSGGTPRIVAEPEGPTVTLEQPLFVTPTTVIYVQTSPDPDDTSSDIYSGALTLAGPDVPGADHPHQLAGLGPAEDFYGSLDWFARIAILKTP